MCKTVNRSELATLPNGVYRINEPPVQGTYYNPVTDQFKTGLSELFVFIRAAGERHPPRLERETLPDGRIAFFQRMIKQSDWPVIEYRAFNAGDDNGKSNDEAA